MCQTRGEQEFNLSVMRVLIKAAFAVWSAMFLMEGLRGLAWFIVTVFSWFPSGLNGRLGFELIESEFPSFISDLFVRTWFFVWFESSDTSTGKGKFLFGEKELSDRVSLYCPIVFVCFFPSWWNARNGSGEPADSLFISPAAFLQEICFSKNKAFN